MSFVAFKSYGKDIIVNTDRIISIEINSESKVLIICTDQVKIEVDESESEIRKRLGIKSPGEKSIGF